MTTLRPLRVIPGLGTADSNAKTVLRPIHVQPRSAVCKGRHCNGNHEKRTR